MTNKSITFLLLCLIFFTKLGYTQDTPCSETLQQSLEKTAKILNENKAVELWNIQLNAPIIIIDRTNNKMFFTEITDGKAAPLKEEVWDFKIPLANSFYTYEGKKYVTLLIESINYAPCESRVNLLAHEIFHYHQNKLGINNTMSANYHMDKAVGRALLQIEMQLLKNALTGNIEDLSGALMIRKHRQSLFPENNEDMYELNEGLAEYTGSKIALDNLTDYAIKGLSYNINTGYTNAFGYVTGMAYACILDNVYPEWRRDEDLLKGMPYLLAKTNPKYNVELNDEAITKWLHEFDYENLLQKENDELRKFGDISLFEKLLLPATSKLTIVNNGISFTYDPNDRIIAFSDAVLLKKLNLKGEWGRINVNSGIMRLNNWSAFYVLPPSEIAGDIIKGDDYEITLNPGWEIFENEGQWTFKKTE